MSKKIFVILFGIIFVGVGIFLLINNNNMAKRCTAEATGKVVEIIEEKEENRDAEESGAIVYDTYVYTYYPVIEYKAGDKTISEKYSVGSGNKSQYKVGEQVDILYDPAKPEDFMIKGEKTSSLMSIIFIVAGAVVAVIGIVKNDF